MKPIQRKGVIYLMKTITKCESKHRRRGLLLSLLCAGVIASFMLGCAETVPVTAYDTNGYYPTAYYTPTYSDYSYYGYPYGYGPTDRYYTGYGPRYYIGY